MWEEGKCVEYFVYKTLSKGQLGRPRHKWKYYVKSDMKERVCVNVWINRFGSIRTRIFSCEQSDEPSGFCSPAYPLVTSSQGGLHCMELVSSKKQTKKENGRRKLIAAHMCILNRYLPFCRSPGIVL